MDVLIHPQWDSLSWEDRFAIPMVIKYLLAQYFIMEMVTEEKDLVALMSNLIPGTEGQELKLGDLLLQLSQSCLLHVVKWNEKYLLVKEKICSNI